MNTSTKYPGRPDEENWLSFDEEELRMLNVALLRLPVESADGVARKQRLIDEVERQLARKTATR